MNPLDIPWWICFPLVVVLYLFAKYVIAPIEDADPGATRWPVMGAISILVALVLAGIGALGLLRMLLAR